jgi:hypothetical protein
VLKNLNVVSENPGIIGIGGIKNDFIVFYASSPGQVYRVYNGEVIDSSRILSRRMTADYFRPEIKRIENSSSRADYYVYSLLSDEDIFLKFWDNIGKINSLSGVLDLYKLLEIKEGGIEIIETNTENAFNQIVIKNKDNYYLYTDKGFKSNLKSEIISSIIPNSATIYDFKITNFEKLNLEFDEDSLNSDKSFNLHVKEIFDVNTDRKYFSDTGYSDDLKENVWKEIDLNKPLQSFSGNKIEGFRLRLVFPELIDINSSPFLNSWTANYYHQKF